jgi:hypothetical protein
MKGFIKRSLALATLSGLTALAGCACDRGLCDCYDNCWPNRYGYQAAMSTQASFNAQVFNGHILDQTIWSYMFKAGSADLLPDGLEHLKYLARRRPCPDTKIWLQTAQDVGVQDPGAKLLPGQDLIYDSANPEKVAVDRAKLDNDRREAILRFLTAETAGRGLVFTVDVHDAPTPGYAAFPYGIAVQKHYLNFQGALPIGSVGGAGSGSSTPR